MHPGACKDNVEEVFIMDLIEQAAEIIKQSDNIVAFTGAGVSTESNIPDFRSASGLYAARTKYNHPPEYMLSHTCFVEETENFFDYYRNNLVYRDAKPNNCHLVLAQLEKMGKLKAVVTQNIDGLHQAAGSKNVYELHGSVYRNYCMKCHKFFDLDYVMDTSKTIPKCDVCGGIVKPDVVLYEESLDQDVIEGALFAIMDADVMLVMGTSLVVYPAAGLLNYYRKDKMILINKSYTPYDYRAKIVIHDSAGNVMKKILDYVLQG